MIPSERQQKILAIVAERGVVGINYLIEQLDVSHMTIRRDIHSLEKKGSVISVSGGIQSLKRLPFEPSHNDKTTMFSAEKERISLCAINYIPEGASVYLDAGTTTLAIAKHIAHRSDLLVVTNDFAIASYLIEHSQCKLIHTGGTVRRENLSSVGTYATRMLLDLYVDVAFISASSWSLKGLTTPDEEKVSVKQAIVESSGKCILVSDSSKYGKVGTFFIIPLTVFDMIITDSHLPDNAAKAMQKEKLSVIVA